MLQSMGSQRVGHDWVTELNWKLHYQREFTICYKWLLNTLCKWILLGKLREEAECQLTSGLYMKCLRKKTGRIPPNCPWWLFLDGRTPGGFSSCSYGFIYVFSKLSTNSMGGVIFQGCLEYRKKKKGRNDEYERKLKREALLCKRQTYKIRARPTEELYLFCGSFIFWFTLLIRIYQDSKDNKMKKIQRLPSCSQFSQSVFTYGQFTIKAEKNWTNATYKG